MKTKLKPTIMFPLSILGGIILGYSLTILPAQLLDQKPQDQVTYAVCPEITIAQISYENKAVNTIEKIDELKETIVKDSKGELNDQQLDDGLCRIMESLQLNNRGIENAVKYADHITYNGQTPMEFDMLIDSVEYSMGNMYDLSLTDLLSLYNGVNSIYSVHLGPSSSMEIQQLAHAQGDIAKALHDNNLPVSYALKLIESYQTYFGGTADGISRIGVPPSEFAVRLAGNLKMLARTGKSVDTAAFFIQQHWMEDDMNNFSSASDYVNERIYLLGNN